MSDAATIQAAGYRADVSAIGASLRTLSHHGRPLIVPYGPDEVRPLYRGALVAPWPNRVVDGRYVFDGYEHQLALTEPKRGHALHGLVNWLRWERVLLDTDEVMLCGEVVPQPGYPWRLNLTMTYSVSEQGLRGDLTATNSGRGAAPYGCCPHPYLVAGPGRIDDWMLTLPAVQRLDVDDSLAPTTLRAVADSDSRFVGRSMAGVVLDHAFTALVRDAAGRTTVTVRHRDGGGVALTWGGWAPWVQIHTADRPEPDNNRVGLAVEPMSCPPDAFNSGIDVVVLGPGEQHTADWLISAC